MMKNIVIVVALVTFVNIQAQAQFVPRSQGDVNLIKNATLAVVLYSTDEKRMKDLEDKPEENAHLSANDEYNLNIKNIVNALWHSSKRIAFVTEAEAQKIIDAKDDQYCLLEKGDFSGRSYTQSGKSYLFTVPVLQVRSAAHLHSALIVTSLPEWYLAKGALTYCVQQLIHQIEDYEKGIGSESQLIKSARERAPVLKNKTLLLCDKVIKGVDKQEASGKLKKNYPYPYEIVSCEKLDEIIASKDDRYAYAWRVPGFKSSEMHTLHLFLIVDAKDGNLLFFNKKQGMAFGFTDPYFTQDHLKEAVKYSRK